MGKIMKGIDGKLNKLKEKSTNKITLQCIYLG